jgi:dTDP-glucose 4,6-dehydratase
MSKTFFVTGGCGFIGSNFLNYMVPRYNDVIFINIDALFPCAKKENVKVSHLPNYHLIECNINNSDMMRHLFSTYCPDLVFHFAAFSHVDGSFEMPLEYLDNNVRGTVVLLETIRKLSLKTKIFHISTDEVYGESDEIAKDENSLLLPTNPYAASKAAAEMMLYSFGKSFNIQYYICRCNNVYGPNQYIEKLIPKFILYLKQGRLCPIHGKGDAVRSFVHAHDVAKAIELIWTEGELGVVYNIGSDDEFTVLEITQKLVSLIYGDSENILNYIEYVDDRSYNDRRYLISYERLKALGWKKTISFEDGLRGLVSIS